MNIPKDPHSFSRPDEAVVNHLALDLSVDFEKRMLSGKATLRIDNRRRVQKLFLDVDDLIIHRATLGNAEAETSFVLQDQRKHLGRALIIDISPDTSVVQLYYSTKPTAAALQWLQPEQTAGRKHPFLFTQSQAALARSWVPCQDTPSVRMTYEARIKTPTHLLAVMSAENPTEKNDQGIYVFKMSNPIPSYLLALAVGDIEFRSTGPRTGVYAEPAVVEKAAWEFAETEKMLQAAERLYGPYRWGRYDLIVLPPSFPWGGMENPRLTFVTPTVLAGDRSLVALVAHELAHSWSGNLVTNASWNDFWLNEGFTTYFEHRIMEVVYGREYEDMLSVLNLQDLHREVAQIGATSGDTHLKLDLADRDPEDATTQIPYEKGQFFLRTIEQAVGRERWDAFLKKYFNEYAFQSVTTEDFLDFLRTHLIQDNEELERKLRIEDWLYKPGVPSNIVEIRSELLSRVENELHNWLQGTPPSKLNTGKWRTQEWLYFLRKIPADVDTQKMSDLDGAFRLSDSQNAEILHEWLLQAVARNYKPAYPAIERFLSSNGRRKYVKSLFTQLAKTPEDRDFAKRIYARTRPMYH
ncbi:MAG TPA: M1 family metallopeptidase, partial [Acidobacteriota bacterium]|nr:M1 family metallopeptidase [Acidobacteriota bacterium]